MKEYIERAQLLKNLGYDETRRADVLPGSTFDIVLKEPAADVVEVRHGRWVDKTNISRAAVEQRVDCSVCGQIFWTTSVLSFNYCPHCGARMDKEDEHEAD